MSNESWSSKLQAVVKRLKPSKIAILGIGHELRGDDAAGLAVVRKISNRADWLVIEAGSAPENHTSTLRRFRPDLVLLIDAAQMNHAPGTLRWLDPAAAAGLNASTHTISLSLLAAYLTAELGCEAWLIGIQPGNNALGASLTPEVRCAVAQVNAALQLLQE